MATVKFTVVKEVERVFSEVEQYWRDQDVYTVCVYSSETALNAISRDTTFTMNDCSYREEDDATFEGFTMFDMYIFRDDKGPIAEFKKLCKKIAKPL